MELRFHPAAYAELRSSADYYSARSAQASQRFAIAVDRAIRSVLAKPGRYERVSDDERACRVEDFPFQVIYRTFGKVVYVIAIAHTSRHPGYWKHRR